MKRHCETPEEKFARNVRVISRASDGQKVVLIRQYLQEMLQREDRFIIFNKNSTESRQRSQSP